MSSSAQWDSYIALLRDSDGERTYLENDKAKEIAYMVANAYRFQYVLELIPRAEDAVCLLDIGPTPFTLLLKRLFPHYEIRALDRTSHLAARFRAAGVELSECDLDDESPPYDDGTFDVVLFTEVLEHIFAPPSDVLRGIRRIIRPGGRLILSVPNFAALHKRIRLLLGYSPLPHPDDKMKKDWLHGHGHLHEYTMGEIVSIVEGVGFRVAARRYLRPDALHTLRHDARPLPSRLLRATYHAAQGLWPSFGTEMLLECVR